MSSHKPPSPPLPVEPLLSFLADDAEAAAESVGVSTATVKRWRQKRATTTITRVSADLYACRLGINPTNVWFHDWW